jgi:hypothetical protein
MGYKVPEGLMIAAMGHCGKRQVQRGSDAGKLPNGNHVILFAGDEQRSGTRCHAIAANKFICRRRRRGLRRVRACHAPDRRLLIVLSCATRRKSENASG